jgi:hypothetical protein
LGSGGGGGGGGGPSGVTTVVVVVSVAVVGSFKWLRFFLFGGGPSIGTLSMFVIFDVAPSSCSIGFVVVDDSGSLLIAC